MGATFYFCLSLFGVAGLHKKLKNFLNRPFYRGVENETLLEGTIHHCQWVVLCFFTLLGVCMVYMKML